MSRRRPEPFWNIDKILGLTAILVSMATFGIYLYQTHLIQKQQSAAVWPYVECYTNYIPQSEETCKYQLVMRNKGVGPALIKNIKIDYFGIKHEGDPNRIYLEKLFGKANVPDCNFAFANGSVIPAGESIILLEVVEPQKFADSFYEIFKATSFKICYASIYQDFWTTEKEKQPVECEGCK
jgi:hypothetical protein